jgi:hypothetical protein
MSERYEGPIPPRHGEDEEWPSSEPLSVCPECGRLLRREIHERKGPDDSGLGPWLCDVHGDVVPEPWYPDEEEEEAP